MCRLREQEEFQDDLKELVTQLQQHHTSRTEELAGQSTSLMDAMETFLDRAERQIVETAKMRKEHDSQLNHYGITYSSIFMISV